MTLQALPSLPVVAPIATLDPSGHRSQTLSAQTLSALTGFALVLAVGFGGSAAAPAGEPHHWHSADVPAFTAFDQAPAGFIAPPLHPKGIQLETRELGPGVYALLSNHPMVDNNGFIVGEKGVLVIDAHINGAMARQIQDAVRAVTDKPILYLVNTNHHGDHSFGNYAFPAETKIIAQRKTAARMADFEHEKAIMLATVGGDTTVFGAVEPRLPDLVFERKMVVDLGGRLVEIHHFGPGNTPGDTVVYEPATRTAWTGNLVVGQGTIPPIFEGGVTDYLTTIATFRNSLDVATIVPGHGFMADGKLLGQYLAYLNDLSDAVRQARQAGKSLDETVATLPIEDFHRLPEAPEMAAAAQFLTGLHRLNVQQAYLDLE